MDHQDLFILLLFILNCCTAWLLYRQGKIINHVIDKEINKETAKLEARQEQNKADSDKRFAEYKKQLEDFKNKPIL